MKKLCYLSLLLLCSHIFSQELDSYEKKILEHGLNFLNGSRNMCDTDMNFYCETTIKKQVIDAIKKREFIKKYKVQFPARAKGDLYLNLRKHGLGSNDFYVPETALYVYKYCKDYLNNQVLRGCIIPNRKIGLLSTAQNNHINLIEYGRYLATKHLFLNEKLTEKEAQVLELIKHGYNSRKWGYFFEPLLTLDPETYLIHGCQKPYELKAQGIIQPMGIFDDPIFMILTLGVSGIEEWGMKKVSQYLSSRGISFGINESLKQLSRRVFLYNEQLRKKLIRKLGLNKMLSSKSSKLILKKVDDADIVERNYQNVLKIIDDPLSKKYSVIAQNHLKKLIHKIDNLSDSDFHLFDKIENQIHTLNNNTIKRISKDLNKMNIPYIVKKNDFDVDIIQLDLNNLSNVKNSTLSYIQRLKKLYKLDDLKIEIDLLENANQGSKALFKGEGIIDIGGDGATSLLKNDKLKYLKHELRHYLEEKSLQRGKDSVYSIKIKNNQSTLGKFPKGYSDGFSADEIYTYSREIIDTNVDLAKNVKKNFTLGISQNLKDLKSSIKELKDISHSTQKFTHDIQNAIKKSDVDFQYSEGIYNAQIKLNDANITIKGLSNPDRQGIKNKIRSKINGLREISKEQLKLADKLNEMIEKVEDKVGIVDLENLEEDFKVINLLIREMKRNI